MGYAEPNKAITKKELVHPLESVASCGYLIRAEPGGVAH